MGFRELACGLPSTWPEQFGVAKNFLAQGMEAIANELSARWEDPRYVRAEFAFD